MVDFLLDAAVVIALVSSTPALILVVTSSLVPEAFLGSPCSLLLWNLHTNLAHPFNHFWLILVMSEDVDEAVGTWNHSCSSALSCPSSCLPNPVLKLTTWRWWGLMLLIVSLGRYNTHGFPQFLLLVWNKCISEETVEFAGDGKSKSIRERYNIDHFQLFFARKHSFGMSKLLAWSCRAFRNDFQRFLRDSHRLSLLLVVFSAQNLRQCKRHLPCWNVVLEVTIESENTIMSDASENLTILQVL